MSCQGRITLLKNKKKNAISNLLFAPAGFWPRGQNPRRHHCSIHRKNLDLTKVGAQIVSGVVRNARKWVLGGLIKFPVR